MKSSSPPITVSEMAKAVQVPQREIARLIKGLRNITPALASKLGSIRETTPNYWVGLQKTHDSQMKTVKPPSTHSTVGVGGFSELGQFKARF